MVPLAAMHGRGVGLSEVIGVDGPALQADPPPLGQLQNQGRAGGSLLVGQDAVALGVDHSHGA